MPDRVWRSGVRFDCQICGRLFRDDPEHAPIAKNACPRCGGDIRMVGKGDSPTVGDANWYRCLSCGQLLMHRRGEVVPTGSRAGFDEFA
jgi:DNA-directed RNA polymerase subunit RPC12/RpoP